MLFNATSLHSTDVINKKGNFYVEVSEVSWVHQRLLTGLDFSDPLTEV